MNDDGEDLRRAIEAEDAAPREYVALAEKLEYSAGLVLSWTTDGVTTEQRRCLEEIAGTLRVIGLVLRHDLHAPPDIRGPWIASTARPCSHCNGLRIVYRGGVRGPCEKCGGTGVQPRARL